MPINADNKAFKDFYNTNKSKFPYKEIRATRNKYHPKLLLLNSNQPSGISFHSGSLFPILASTMDSDTVQHLIISRQATPLPPDFSSILDDMYHWGRAINPNWYYKTLELFDYYLRMDDLDRRMMTTRQLCFDIIQMRVLQQLGDRYPDNTQEKHEGHAAWVLRFNNHIASEFEPNDFFGMAVASFQYISHLMYEIDTGGYGPFSDSDEDADDDELALPDSVESSP